ncbi:hypothetical protein MAR_034215, partial [Mya arenaria]
CVDFIIYNVASNQAGCDPFAIEEGLPGEHLPSDLAWCMRQCLRTPGCLATAFYGAGKGGYNTCTYHACNNYTASTNATNLTIRECRQEVIPVLQKCLNCQQGIYCQGAFALSTTDPEETCIAGCESKATCTGLHYENGNCEAFHCSLPQIKYNSTFYRKTYNGGDERRTTEE